MSVNSGGLSYNRRWLLHGLSHGTCFCFSLFIEFVIETVFSLWKREKKRIRLHQRNNLQCLQSSSSWNLGHFPADLELWFWRCTDNLWQYACLHDDFVPIPNIRKYFRSRLLLQCLYKNIIISLQANVPFQYSRRTSENRRFSDVFRAHRNGA